MQNHYDVIIIGGGPVGAALGIELGLNGVRTLILEKYSEPLLSPRAQSLNERSMELCMRWGIAEKLKNSMLLPKDYPMQGVWCSKLNGITYATASSHAQFKKNESAQNSIRVPLYITENILRSRLNDFNCVSYLKNKEVMSVVIENDFVQVIAKNKADQTTEKYTAKYVVGCDGANSVTRESLHIPFEGLAPKRRVLNILFESKELQDKITVEKGFIYYIMGSALPAPMGPVDLEKGIWYAQIICSEDGSSIEKMNVDLLLEEITGLHFNKIILNAHFWDMQIQLAENFSKDNRVFLVGDSAHAFAPTGGFGLNTGLGDVTNLAWKLSAAIKNCANEKLLTTYEQERKPVCLRNLIAAEKNSHDAIMVRETFPPEKEPKKFADENARIAKQHSHSAGITMGYTYNQDAMPMLQSEYIPTAKPGYFLPNMKINEKSIYELLSPIQWTLIVCGKEKIKIKLPKLKILHVPENAYPSRYILIRPDWHIVMIGDSLNNFTFPALII